MAERIDELAQRVMTLSREEVLEAATAVGRLLEHEGAEPGPEAAALLADVEERPLAHLEDIEGLARVLLLEAAADPDLRDDVAKVVSASGGTAFIFGGAELIALAGLAVIGLQTVLSKGRTREVQTIEYELDENGTPIRMRVHNEVEYGLTPGVARIISSGQQPPV